MCSRPPRSARAERVRRNRDECRPSSVYLANTLARVGPDGVSGRRLLFRRLRVWTRARRPPGRSRGSAAARLLGRSRRPMTWLRASATASDDLLRRRRAGRLRTDRRAFTLRGIVPMEGAALDKGLVPEFEGITDAATMADWNPPFPMDLKRIRPKDEATGRVPHRAEGVPGAGDGPRPLGPRPARAEPAQPDGGLTSVALAPPEGMSLEAAAERFESAFRRGPAADFGLAVQPVRAQALAAAQGHDGFRRDLSLDELLPRRGGGGDGRAAAAAGRRAAREPIRDHDGHRLPGAKRGARAHRRGTAASARPACCSACPAGIGYAWLIIRALRTLVVGRGRGFESRSSRDAAEPGDRRGGGIPGLRGRRPLGRAAAAPHADAATARRLAGDGRAAAEAHPPARARNRHRRRWSWRRDRSCAGCWRRVRPKAPSWAAARCMLAGFLALACAGFQRAERAPAEKVSLWRLGWRGASRDWLRSLLTAGLHRVRELHHRRGGGEPKRPVPLGHRGTPFRRGRIFAPRAKRRSDHGRPEHGRRPRGAWPSARSRRRIRRDEVPFVPHDRRR